jgi:tetratricopeptide (TPR) repeat protein
VEQHPELLSDAALEMLEDIAHSQDNGDLEGLLRERLALLRRCREVGIAQAFAEKASSAEISAELIGILQVIGILQELSQPATPMKMARRADLCRRALMYVSRDAQPELWAMLKVELGGSLAQSVTGDRAENLEWAIGAYQDALTVRTREAMPVEWATTMNNLAAAYADRIRGDQAENLERAIEAYQQALTVRTREAMPVEWAETMMNLANAYQSRIRGERAENLERAIEAYQDALTVFKPLTLPNDCRRTARGLARLLCANRRFAPCAEAAQLALQANDALLQAALLRASKQSELEEVQGLAAIAAYALAQLGDAVAAAQVLERGRARLLGEALERSRHDLARLRDLGYAEHLARFEQAIAHREAIQRRLACRRCPVGRPTC